MPHIPSPPDAPALRRPRGNSRPPRMGQRIAGGVAVLVVAAIVVLILISTGVFGAKGSDTTRPLDFAEGDCLTEFRSANEPAVVVPCDEPHEAQLVATFAYDGDTSFPGVEALRRKADQTCEGVRATPAATGHELRVQKAYPTETSWAAGDRRVDCFYRVRSGNDLTGSLVR